MKTEKHNNNDSDDSSIKRLNSIIEQRKNENEALRKILEGLEKIKKETENKNNKNQKAKK